MLIDDLPPSTNGILKHEKSSMLKANCTKINSASAVQSKPSEIESIIQRLSEYGNPSLYVTPEHTIELRETEVPVPSATQALIHVRCTGICGSDMHLWHKGAIGPLVVDRPCILGHEPAGVVMAVGSAVTNLKPGDRVAIEPGVSCNNCSMCRSGRYNLCAEVEFAGVCPCAGTLRRFTTHESRYCHRIPDSMTFAQAALLEPLSVILHAINQCNGSIGIGKPLLVCGAGPIGLIALACARASGAYPLILTDIDAGRLQFAREWMPEVQTYLIDVSQKKSPEVLGAEIRQLFGCRPETPQVGVNGHQKLSSASASTDDPDYPAPATVLECTGVASSIATAAHVCRRGGTVMVVGVGASYIDNLPFMHLSLREIQLKFINRYVDTWPAGINALNEARVVKGLDKLVTHTFPLEKAVEAMACCADRTQASIKVQVEDGEIPIPQ